ncbi:MAG: Gfo/Idh/MocA family oxidoreductase [Clostridia bacterium]|nr:Gfo/Idh/MocA family oxidoreductase [Clostridia bacterium]
MQAVRAGIIGFGYMGHFHLRRIREMPETVIQVIAAYDIKEDKLQEAREEGLRAYERLEDFLADREIELVIVCTPNNVHAELSIACLNAGKHVLCEKPVTMNCAELDRVIAAAEKNGKLFTSHQNRRWDVDFLMVKQAVESGDIGHITSIQNRVYGQRGVCFGWRADPVAGGGMLYDWGVHLIDQMLMLYKGEKVESVYARLLSVLTPAVDDYFELSLRFSGGTTARISVGTFALQKLPRWFLFGDRGTMRLDDFSGKIGGMARIRENVKGFDSVVGQKSLGPSRTMAPLEKEMLEPLPLPEIEEQPLAYWDDLLTSLEEGRAESLVKKAELLRQMKIVDAAFLSSEREEVVKTDI